FARHCGDIAEAPVGLDERGLGLLSGIDIGDDAGHADGTPIGVALGDAALGMQPLPAAVARRRAELGLVLRRLALQRAHPGLARRAAIVRMDRAEELLASRDGRRALMAEKARPAVAGIELVARGEVVPLGHVAAIEREFEARLRLLQAALGVALLGDVAPDAAIADEAAFRAVVRLPGDDMH